MKKICSFFIALVIISMAATAQNFEGILKYDLKYSGEAVAQFASMMPSSYTMKLKGAKSRFSIQGGMVAAFMGDVISYSDKEQAFILMPQQKTAYKVSTKDAEKTAKEKEIKPVVTNTGVTEKINGYNCTKYKVTIKTDDGEVTSYIWASTDLAVKFPKAAMQNALSSYEGINGFPVKIEQNMSQMGISFTMNILLAEAKEMKIADSEFVVPSEYKVEEGLPNFGGMMGK
jgi:uncharacterized protein Usg